VGFYLDANYAYHRFIRNTRGNITTVDAPGAGTGAYQGTNLFSVNPAGLMVGEFLAVNNIWHGLLVIP